MPGREHEIETVAQTERDAFDDRPGEMAPIVREGQPDERAAGERVRVRAALPGQVRQEEQAVAAAALGTVAAARRGSPKSARPGASASRNQRRLPAAESMTDIMCQRPGTAWQKAWTRAVRARRAAGPSPRRRRPRSRARAPSRPGRRRRPRPRSPPGRRRRPRRASRPGARSPSAAAAVDRAGHLRALERRRHPRRVDAAARRAISGDQSRAARSNRIVPAPSALSIAWSPVSRRRT